jgi:hypothetical protein
LLGDTLKVNFTTTYQGKIVNCIAITYAPDFMDDKQMSYTIEDGTEIKVIDGLPA